MLTYSAKLVAALRSADAVVPDLAHIPDEDHTSVKLASAPPRRSFAAPHGPSPPAQALVSRGLRFFATNVRDAEEAAASSSSRPFE